MFSNPKIRSKNFFEMKMNVDILQKLIFCMRKNLKKLFAKILSVSSFFHFCPVTTLANFCWFFIDFFFQPEKRYPTFLCLIKSRKKQHIFPRKNLVCITTKKIFKNRRIGEITFLSLTYYEKLDK